MNIDVLLNGGFGLTGAVLGGLIAASASVKATKMQLQKQDEQDQELKRQKIETTKNTIETFLINEIKYNLDQLKDIKSSFLEEHGNVSHERIHTDFKFKLEEYEKFKFKLMEITTIETLKVVEIYQMFYMLSATHNGSRLSRFDENELGFIKHRYKLANDFASTYYREKLKHF